MKKILCFGLVLILLLALPLGCRKKEAEIRTVELHEVTRSVFYAPQYVALNLGYFEAEGLQVNITTSGGSDKAMTALLSGDADVCLAGPETAVYVYNAGQAQHPDFSVLLLIRTRCPDTSSKATLWMKALHVGHWQPCSSSGKPRRIHIQLHNWPVTP